MKNRSLRTTPGAWKHHLEVRLADQASNQGNRLCAKFSPTCLTMRASLECRQPRLSNCPIKALRWVNSPKNKWPQKNSGILSQACCPLIDKQPIHIKAIIRISNRNRAPTAHQLHLYQQPQVQTSLRRMTSHPTSWCMRTKALPPKSALCSCTYPALAQSRTTHRVCSRQMKFIRSQSLMCAF